MINISCIKCIPSRSSYLSSLSLSLINQRGGAAGGRGGKGHRRQTSTGKSPALNNSKSKNSTANLPPVAPLQASEGRWVRPQVASDEDNEAKFRKSQGILNKLTIEKFESLSTNLLNVGITNIEVLRVSEPRVCIAVSLLVFG